MLFQFALADELFHESAVMMPAAAPELFLMRR